MADSSENKDTYKTGNSDDRLVQLHVRFRRSTLEEISEISEGMKWSKASVVRYLVEIGLSESNFTSEEPFLKFKCLECSQELVQVEEDRYACENCGLKMEAK
jgi:DNA-directed RNA polymerase subunit RPC12/RpoP